MEGEYKVLELKKYGGNPEVSKRPFRNLEKGEILVKIMCATIHPADLAFLRGQYGHMQPDKMPIVPGFEGSGLIEKVGEDVDPSLVGKRTGVFANSNVSGTFEGLWAQYHITRLEYLIVFDKEVDYDKIAFAVGNPFTAAGFVDTVKKAGVKAVVQNGSSSAFGKIFARLCHREGILTINIVRREEHFPMMKALGADYVFSTSDPNWEKDVAQCAKEHNATIGFECVGGDDTGKFLAALPDKGICYHFGNLAMKRLGEIDTWDMLLRQKKMEGWYLMKWWRSLTPDEFKYWKDYIVNDLAEGGDIFLTKVSKAFSLDDAEAAFEYYLTNMSEGKILFQPNN
jgi:NADPH2:quinone reductase